MRHQENSTRCYNALTQHYIPKGNPLHCSENVKADFTDSKSSSGVVSGSYDKFGSHA